MTLNQSVNTILVAQHRVKILPQLVTPALALEPQVDPPIHKSPELLRASGPPLVGLWVGEREGMRTKAHMGPSWCRVSHLDDPAHLAGPSHWREFRNIKEGASKVRPPEVWVLG